MTKASEECSVFEVQTQATSAEDSIQPGTMLEQVICSSPNDSAAMAEGNVVGDYPEAESICLSDFNRSITEENRNEKRTEIQDVEESKCDYAPLSLREVSGSEAPDGGWGWAIVFGAFLVSFLMTGLLKSFGILYVAILEVFSEATAASVAWIPGILNTLSLVLSPFSNALSGRFGCRTVVFVGGLISALGMGLSSLAPNIQILTLTSGAVTGVGATMALTPSIFLVGQYFDKKRALANSLSLCGSGLGGLALPLFLDWSLDEFGLRGTYLISAGLLLNMCVSAMLYMPLDVYWKSLGYHIQKQKRTPSLLQKTIPLTSSKTCCTSSLRPPDDQHLCRRRCKLHSIRDKIVATFSLAILADTVFLLIATSVVFMSMGTPHVLFFLPSYAETAHGLSKYKSALLLSVASAGDLSGRAFLGYISDKKLFRRDHEYMVAIFASAAATIGISVISHYTLLCICCFIYGIGTGTWQCFVPVLLADCLGTEKLGGTLSFSRMFQGLSNLLVPFIVGLILDLSGHYSYVFMWMASSMTVAGFVAGFLPKVLERKKNRTLS